MFLPLSAESWDSHHTWRLLVIPFKHAPFLASLKVSQFFLSNVFALNSIHAAAWVLCCSEISYIKSTSPFTLSSISHKVSRQPSFCLVTASGQKPYSSHLISLTLLSLHFTITSLVFWTRCPLSSSYTILGFHKPLLQIFPNQFQWLFHTVLGTVPQKLLLSSLILAHSWDFSPWLAGWPLLREGYGELNISLFFLLWNVLLQQVNLKCL